MSLDEALRQAVREVLREELGQLRPVATNAKALTRRQAEKAMGVGRSKLQELIASGAIKTVKDNPRLVPSSEVERYCQPRRQKPRRRTSPAAPPPVGTTDPERARQMLVEANRRRR